MPTPTYEPLASVTITTAQTQVTFSNIPQTYTDLVLVISGGGSSSGDSTVFRVNGDSGTNYSSTELYGTGSAAGSQRSTSATFGRITFSSDFGTTLTSNSIMNFMNYSNNVTNKTVISRSNVPSSTYPSTDAIVSLWRNTASINSILVYPTSGNWLVDTTFNLYGVGANTLKATGGDIITTDGTYWYHAFRTSGTFTPASTLSCDVLVLAGGGGGGFDNGGGAGAGGVAYQTGRSVSSATTITVGAGGAGSSSSSIPGSSGSDSIFATITANGGGGGGSGGLATGARNGRSGGSGGGASRNGTVGSANQGTSGGATGYGFAGGAGYDADPYDGGGGGGAGAVGFSGTAISSPRTGGGGGAGLNTWSSWASVTGTGVNGLYAGGGGAGGYSTTIVAGGAGGSGGGGNGGFWSGTVAISRPQTGVVNTGSGGGGGASGDAGATGGSGLVIVRYAV